MRTSPDLADVLAQIRSLKRRRLTRSHAADLAELEARASALAAPVYALPVELVSAIFVLAATADPRFPLTASHVSRSWRAIAQAYAPLWSNIRIGLPPPRPMRRSPSLLSIGYAGSEADSLLSFSGEEELLYSELDDEEEEEEEGGVGQQLAELAYFLARAGQSPLAISLEWAEQSGSSSLLAKAVRPHIARCASLRLANRGPALPHLTSITPCPTPPHASRLRALDLAGFCMKGLDDALHLLAHMPALRSLALRDVHFSPSPPQAQALMSDIASSEGPLVLPQLADLLVDEWAPYLCTYLLPCIQTPRLQALTLSAHTCDPKHLSHLELCPPVGSWDRVRFVRARGCAFTDACVLELLQQAPNAESVLVHGGLLSDALLQMLAQPVHGAWLAPRLKSAYLHTRLRFSQEAVMRFIDARLPPPPRQQPLRAQQAKCVPYSPPMTPMSPVSPHTPSSEASGSTVARVSPPAPALPPTPTSPTSPANRAQHTAPTPLRLLGLFGIPRTPSPAPPAHNSPFPPPAHSTSQSTQNLAPGQGLDSAFRLWLSQRVGPESRTVPDWGEFRRRILERVASGSGGGSGRWGWGQVLWRGGGRVGRIYRRRQGAYMARIYAHLDVPAPRSRRGRRRRPTRRRLS
ncbi:hypothetical protein CALCODRAFT_372233 [Calocera cornea HHB12733]|uniref:F-box domain-containing protein n=1 Tax=Calocera cornea HHB12733 TaxID=1353952 RepID=A0A165EGP2_9BASI|nr:hypothetical protein CALCODRAFT_372233 [Calocera cornea HHB12733]